MKSIWEKKCKNYINTLNSTKIRILQYTLYSYLINIGRGELSKMKKIYTTPEYKQWQKRRIRKFEILLRSKNTPTRKKNKGKKKKHAVLRHIKKHPVFAPKDFRLVENTEACLLFFRNIRSEEYMTQFGDIRYVNMSLKEVTEIDYGTISVLTSISDDLKFKGIILRGNFPTNTICKRFIIDSGFLNHMVNEKNQKFPKAEKSDLIFFEKGCGVLSAEENRKISALVKNVVNHLTGEQKHCLPVKTIILEICGNSIEWGCTQNKQWLLGVKYEEGKVIFTVTDVGKGILETLHRKFGIKLKDIFTNKSNAEILLGAFNQKYGSSTQEVNRNKGLPAVRVNSESGAIHNLKVLTNNVILHFTNKTLSRTFEPGYPRFRGTLYQWEMTKECIIKNN